MASGAIMSSADLFTKQTLNQYKAQLRAKSNARPEVTNKKNFLTQKFLSSGSKPRSNYSLSGSDFYSLSFSQKPSPRASIHTSGFNSVMLKSRSEASSSFGSYSSPTRTRLTEVLPLEQVLRTQRALADLKPEELRGLAERYVAELRKFARLVEEKVGESAQFPLS